MKSSLEILRDRSAGTAEFRRAADDVCGKLMRDMQKNLEGKGVDPKSVVIVIILRAAIAFMGAAIAAFPDAPIGVLGMKRDERTLAPYWYYENLPPISGASTIVILDPMLATGGSVGTAVERLQTRGADLARIHFVGVVGVPMGVASLTSLIPKENIVLGAVDEKLDDHGMIVPGLGDFGDRYFGHSGRAVMASEY